MHNIAYVTTNMSTSLTYWDPYWDVQGITARYASQGRLLGLLLRLLFLGPTDASNAAEIPGIWHLASGHLASFRILRY